MATFAIRGPAVAPTTTVSSATVWQREKMPSSSRASAGDAGARSRQRSTASTHGRSRTGMDDPGAGDVSPGDPTARGLGMDAGGTGEPEG